MDLAYDGQDRIRQLQGIQAEIHQRNKQLQHLNQAKILENAPSSYYTLQMAKPVSQTSASQTRQSQRHRKLSIPHPEKDFFTLQHPIRPQTDDLPQQDSILSDKTEQLNREITPEARSHISQSRNRIPSNRSTRGHLSYRENIPQSDPFQLWQQEARYNNQLPVVQQKMSSLNTQIQQLTQQRQQDSNSEASESESSASSDDSYTDDFIPGQNSYMSQPWSGRSSYYRSQPPQIYNGQDNQNLMQALMLGSMMRSNPYAIQPSFPAFHGQLPLNVQLPQSSLPYLQPSIIPVPYQTTLLPQQSITLPQQTMLPQQQPATPVQQLSLPTQSSIPQRQSSIPQRQSSIPQRQQAITSPSQPILSRQQSITPPQTPQIRQNYDDLARLQKIIKQVVEKRGT